MCSSISNEGNAEWDETIANGQTVNGECLNGFNGSISRSCIQSGSIGVWGPISGSCDGFFLFSFFFSFVFQGNKQIDIDECVMGDNNCNIQANCENTGGLVKQDILEMVTLVLVFLIIFPSL